MDPINEYSTVVLCKNLFALVAFVIAYVLGTDITGLHATPVLQIFKGHEPTEAHFALALVISHCGPALMAWVLHTAAQHENHTALATVKPVPTFLPTAALCLLSLGLASIGYLSSSLTLILANDALLILAHAMVYRNYRQWRTIMPRAKWT